MELQKTKLPDVLIILPEVFSDVRGFFLETYHYEKLKTLGLKTRFVQDNHSKSTKGTLRGLHFQKGAVAQAKLVRCISGEILDVAVDIRKKSPTFGQTVTQILSAENKLQMFVPQGFAHGFLVLSAAAEVLYKCDNYYAPLADAGIIWNDPDLNIEWGIEAPLLSAKDAKLPRLKDISKKDLF